MASVNGVNGTNGSEPRKAVKGLGSLEAQLMGALWDAPGRLSVQEVCDSLGPDHNYKTVMTVLNRLVDKGLLGRELDGRAYKYRPRQTRDQFLEAVADELVHGYVESYGTESARHLSTAVASMAPSAQRTRTPAAPAPTQQRVAIEVRSEDAAKLAPLALLFAAAVVLQVFILFRSRD